MQIPLAIAFVRKSTRICVYWMAKNELEYTHLGTRGLFASTYSDIRDDSPDEVVRKIQGQYPGVGITMLKGLKVKVSLCKEKGVGSLYSD